MKNWTSENRWEFFRQASKIVPEWNAHLEIFCRIQAIENSRQYLFLRTDILQKTVVGCPRPCCVWGYVHGMNYYPVCDSPVSPYLVEIARRNHSSSVWTEAAVGYGFHAGAEVIRYRLNIAWMYLFFCRWLQGVWQEIWLRKWWPWNG